ncbi:MAG: hypothetical protein J7J82_03890 [Staphylothermus sp.]|nr:hypothetical protein [Staphylothermus sp.]
MISLQKISAYILAKKNCLHPFRISRIIALAELICMEKYGKRITNAKYVGNLGVFYIDGLKEELLNSPCFEKLEDQGCIKYVCDEEINIEKNARACIDEAIRIAEKASDIELNNIVVQHKLFQKLLG